MSMFTEFSYASVLMTILFPVNGRHLQLTEDIHIYSFPVSIRVAEIHVMLYLLPVNGRHLLFPTRLNIGLYSQ